MVSWWVVVLGGLVGLAVLDRLLLAAESRGWIFYRRRRPPAGAGSMGMLTVMSIYQPGHEHLVEERFRAAAKVQEADDDEPLDWPPALLPSRGTG